MKYARAWTALLLAGLLAGPVCLAAPRPKVTYSQEYRRLTAEFQRRRHAQAFVMLDQMLKKYKAPAQAQELRLLKAEKLGETGKHAEALKELASLRDAFKEDKTLQAQSLLLSAASLRGLKRFPEAVATYQKVAKDFAAQPDRAADALVRAGDVLGTDLKKYPEALASYAAVEKQFPTLPRRCSAAVLKIATINETQTKDLLKAAAAYAKLTSTYAALHPQNILAGHYTRQVACLRGAKKLPEALAALKKGEKALQEVRYRTPMALAQLGVLVEMKNYPGVRGEADRIICEYPLELEICQAAQTRVVDAYRAESKFAECLGSARTLYDAAGSERNIRAAAHVVARGFRSVDGNLARANVFLAYQRFGPLGKDGKPNTPDDQKVNHLPAVRYPASTPARNQRFTAAVNAQPKTYRGYRTRAYLYVYWGKPKEAAQQFRLAFQISADSLVPQAAHELVLVGLKAYRASFAGLDRVFEYISYGPKGKDGKQNILDPFQGL